ncbi:hypothetical protein ACIBG8_01020 [Nonomuraea sp. NPDC050556]|uniref:hypothetical protein n=1 Tax=Nonomuraea sp. NPDC050556 TaxID=3364369 RepID=UPI00378D011D
MALLPENDPTLMSVPVVAEVFLGVRLAPGDTPPTDRGWAPSRETLTERRRRAAVTAQGSAP